MPSLSSLPLCTDPFEFSEIIGDERFIPKYRKLLKLKKDEKYSYNEIFLMIYEFIKDIDGDVKKRKNKEWTFEDRKKYQSLLISSYLTLKAHDKVKQEYCHCFLNNFKKTIVSNKDEKIYFNMNDISHLDQDSLIVLINHLSPNMRSDAWFYFDRGASHESLVSFLFDQLCKKIIGKDDEVVYISKIKNLYFFNKIYKMKELKTTVFTSNKNVDKINSFMKYFNQINLIGINNMILSGFYPAYIFDFYNTEEGFFSFITDRTKKDYYSVYLYNFVSRYEDGDPSIVLYRSLRHNKFIDELLNEQNSDQIILDIMTVTFEQFDIVTHFNICEYLFTLIDKKVLTFKFNRMKISKSQLSILIDFVKHNKGLNKTTQKLNDYILKKEEGSLLIENKIESKGHLKDQRYNQILSIVEKNNVLDKPVSDIMDMAFDYYKELKDLDIINHIHLLDSIIQKRPFGNIDDNIARFKEFYQGINNG